MNLKLVNSEKGSNTGSAKGVMNYLEKENQGKLPSEKEWFFSHDQDQVGIKEAIRALDHNRSRLSNKDAKFFMLNISPSQKELQFLGNDPQKLKAYTRQVMEAYAENFGKGLKGKDLLYYAKIEHSRSYRGDDLEVRTGVAKQGELKPGLQTHIHVIVSRKDKANRLKLSPLSTHRRTRKGPVQGGFDRERFVQTGERIFDRMFAYPRQQQERFERCYQQKHDKPLSAKDAPPLQAELNAPLYQPPVGKRALAQIRSLHQGLNERKAEHRPLSEKKRSEQAMER